MTPSEIEAQRLDLLLVFDSRFRTWRKARPWPADRPPSLSSAELAGAAELAAELEKMHADNVRRHGATRATLGRWTALLRLADFLRRSEERRKMRALLEATEALERAQEAERGEARWLRVSVWIAVAVDEASARLGRRAKLVNRIDFSPSPSQAEYREPLEVDDIATHEEDEDLPW